MNIEKERTRILFEDGINALDNGDIRKAIKIAYQLKKHNNNAAAGCLLIEIGSDTKKEEFIFNGINILEKNLRKILKNNFKSDIYYNLANGYMSLVNIELKKNQHKYYLSKRDSQTNLDKAKKLYCRALKHSYEEKNNNIQLYINYAICLTMNGRVIEAFYYYEKALALSKTFSKTFLHYGLALEYYSSKTSNIYYEHLRNALKLLKKADRFTTSKYEKEFIKNKIATIEKYLRTKGKIKSKNTYKDIEFKNSYEEFCYSNGLYLNFCFPCIKCEKAISDTLFFESMHVPKNQITNEISNYPPQVLSRFFNLIKIDYSTARFLCNLYIEKPEDLKYLDEKVLLVDTFDYNVYDSYIPLLKLSFKTAYDILDKIAYSLNYYLKLNIPEHKVDYKNIWDSIIKKEAILKNSHQIPNYNLQALYDIYKDLESGDLKKLNFIRNLLTHRFLDICDMYQRRKKTSLYEEDLLEKTLHLLQVIKGAIYYFIMYIIEEEKKNIAVAESTDIIAKMQFPTFNFIEKCAL